MKTRVTEAVLITLRTHRPPPIRTLETFGAPRGFTTVIIAAPKVYEAHRKHYKKWNDVLIVKGRVGLTQQAMACYAEGRKRGFPYVFRLDDDLGPQTFVHQDGSNVHDMRKLIGWAYECALRTKCSLVGFQNTIRRDWMHDGYGRAYSLVGSPACLSESLDPRDVNNPKLTYLDDVWQTLAHWKRDGAVGRVRFVGINWQYLMKHQTSITANRKSRDESLRLILRAFPEYIKSPGRRKNGEPIFVYTRKRP